MDSSLVRTTGGGVKRLAHQVLPDRKQVFLTVAKTGSLFLVEKDHAMLMI